MRTLVVFIHMRHCCFSLKDLKPFSIEMVRWVGCIVKCMVVIVVSCRLVGYLVRNQFSSGCVRYGLDYVIYLSIIW